jgi:protein phosphatase
VQPEAEPDEIYIGGGKHLSVAPDSLSLRELLAIVEQGIYWWKQKLQTAEGVSRERAAAALKDLSRILDSLSQQLAQGRETVRITTNLPAQRTATVTCPVCGRGNRAGARYCVACGSTITPELKESAAPATTLTLQVAARTDRGRVRERNEDTVYTGALRSGEKLLATLLLVADGMGGAQAGEVASQLAAETVKQTLLATLQEKQPASDNDWQELLRMAANAANHQVYQESQRSSGKAGMGTTLTLVAVVGQRAHIAHVGDSRAYLLNRRGVTEAGQPWLQLTTDHTLVARLVDIGHITPEQARSHPQRNILYRSLGTDPTTEIDTTSQQLQAGDVLLLCSDGLDSYLDDREIAQLALNESTSPLTACDQLVALANQRGGGDNISVVVAKVGH